ncbi:MAG: hypothetical protein ACK5HL_04590 [Bacilli bacterium]
MKEKIIKILKYTSSIVTLAILVCGINYVIPKFFEKTKTNINIVKNSDQSNEVAAETIGQNDCLYFYGDVVIGIRLNCFPNNSTLPSVYRGKQISSYDIILYEHQKVHFTTPWCVQYYLDKKVTLGGTDSAKYEGPYYACGKAGKGVHHEGGAVDWDY